MTTEQRDDCDTLLRFAERCASYSRAVHKGVPPLTLSQFVHAVVFRMQDKTEEEQHYLVHFARTRLPYR
jgi:hypothetical protein